MNGNEALIVISEDAEEWYGHFQSCSVCDTTFMCDDPLFCPGCARKFVGTKKGKEIIYCNQSLNN